MARGSPSASPKRSRPRRRTTTSSDDAGTLAALARETKRKIQWGTILRGASTNGIQWKWLENTYDFSLYTKQGSALSGTYGVLAIGTINASVQEVASLLASSSQEEYEHKMAALHDKEFKHGAYVSDVPTDAVDDYPLSATQLSVRSATFSRPQWLRRDDEWTFLEATQYDVKTQRFEKVLTTLAPDDTGVSPGKSSAKSANRFRGIIAAYNVEPEDSRPSEGPVGPPSVRVHFYAELEAGPSTQRVRRFVRGPTKHEASVRAMKQRLVTVAKDCDRLSQLVRRRRLGVQVLVDQRRVLPLTKAECVNCDKTPLIPKTCRVCGQAVCSDCSRKCDRETHKLQDRNNRVRLETIRICHPCLKRIDSADYSHMSDAALSQAAVFPDRQSDLTMSRRTAASALKQLLQDELLEAPSAKRKDAVMSVIRCVLDQEKELEASVTPSMSIGSCDEPVMLTPLHAESDYLHALDGLEFQTTPYDKVETADMDGRAYALCPTNDVATPMPFPVTDTEVQRQTEIEKVGILNGGCDELNIICDIAAKEMDAFATIVTIITAEEQHIVAANVPTLENMKMKREDSFCQHTIMSDKPLIVPNPEADVRFSRIMPVTGMGIRYYCGFPITSGDDNTVIGTLCCVDQKKHDLTESQFNAMQKLAQTAAKVVKIQGERRRTLSTNPLQLSDL